MSWVSSGMSFASGRWWQEPALKGCFVQDVDIITQAAFPQQMGLNSWELLHVLHWCVFGRHGVTVVISAFSFHACTHCLWHLCPPAWSHVSDGTQLFFSLDALAALLAVHSHCLHNNDCWCMSVCLSGRNWPATAAPDACWLTPQLGCCNSIKIL